MAEDLRLTQVIAKEADIEKYDIEKYLTRAIYCDKKIV